MQQRPNFCLNLLEFIREQVSDKSQRNTRDSLDIQVLKWAYKMLTSGAIMQRIEDFDVFCSINLQIPKNIGLFQSELKFIDQFAYIAQPEEVNVAFTQRFGDGSFPLFKAAQVAKHNMEQLSFK